MLAVVGSMYSFAAKLVPSAAAALRLLLFTGCRLREILHLNKERRLNSVAQERRQEGIRRAGAICVSLVVPHI
jgi:hypothetical protein